jgi:hypothetical protein
MREVTEEFKRGDRVEWNTSQGTTRGIAKTKLTSPATIKGHTVEVSKETPEYLVKSEKADAEAAHKPSALTKANPR